MKRSSMLFLFILFLACAPAEEPSASGDASPVGTRTDAPTSTSATSAPVPPSSSTSAPPARVISGQRLEPVDEASQDASLVAWRNELLDAVRRKDVDAIVAAADSKIRTSFGPDSGNADALRKKLQEPGIWQDLEQILTLGGSFLEGGSERSFWAPYVYSNWPDDTDAFTHVAAIRENVPVRSAPAASAPSVAMLSWNIVEYVSEKDGWVEIKAGDGTSGWVEKMHVRSPIGYRVNFMRREGGGWRITALVAGD